MTGTPGTGKTTAVEAVDTDLETVHLNEVVKEYELTTGHDDSRDSAIVDLDAVEEWLAGRSGMLFESHLAHRFEADSVVVLRCHPSALETRLADHSEASIRENAESEALDVILSEAVKRHGAGNVYEVDTTDRSPAAVGAEIESVLQGTREPSAGTVSFVEYL